MLLKIELLIVTTCKPNERTIWLQNIEITNSSLFLNIFAFAVKLNQWSIGGKFVFQTL